MLPESGEHFFIECNPRIQVEHTVTEQVMGVDLVEAQFRIAAGATLEEIGLGSQQTVGEPRGFAVQARVVAQGAGTIAAYKEPSGVGVRVDGCGYAGYAPPPQFDPLLAKVVGSSGSAASFASAVDRTLQALSEFQVAGLPTNVDQLRAILSHDELRGGDARTSLLADHPQLLNGSASGLPAGAALELLNRQTPSLGPATPTQPVASTADSLDVAPGDRGVECPMASTVVELRAKQGDKVAIGDILLIVSAMKMETNITAPCAGEITDLQELAPGDAVGAGQIVAAITPLEGDAADAASASDAQTWQPLLDEVATLQSLALKRLAPDSEEPGVVRQRSRGKLNCRERIDLLLDDGSFREVGSVTGFATHDEYGDIVAFTPANHVGGWGTIAQRTAIVCADDFTSRGGHADGAHRRQEWLPRPPFLGNALPVHPPP